MAIRSVVDIVKSKLPWLSDGTKDTEIAQFQSEMYHFMEKHLGQSGQSDTEIEDQNNYSALQNMMIADMVAYEMGKQWVSTVMGGTSSTASVQKMLKKAKADVVESEFVQVDTGKGSFMLPTMDWFKMMLNDICSKSRELGISNPLCFDPNSISVTTPFIVGSDYPSDQPEDTYDKILGGNSIG